MGKRIMWINTVGVDDYDTPIASILASIRESGTEVEVVSLRLDGPASHVEYRAYEALATPEIVRLAYAAGRNGIDALVIGCFYDTALPAAREVSGPMLVTAPCIAALQTVEPLAERFSVLVTRRKCIGHMVGNIRAYGAEHKLASMRSLDIGVAQLQADPGITERRIEEEARRAVEEDGAEAILLGCTVEFGFAGTVQKRLGVPVLDAVSTPFKLAEHLAGLKQRFGWMPSRIGNGEPPPDLEAARFGLGRAPMVGNRLVA
jgi:Asp/Glu/hydantoin racemase